MSDIFISYRRNSVQVVDHVHEKLTARFPAGKVFLDRDDIAPGEPFPQRIRNEVTSARIVLVFIGTNWISMQDERTFRRRLEMPEDWVHQEIELALAGTAIVIPVVIEDVAIPTKEQLPESLQKLADCNALVLSRSHFQVDVEKLIEEIKKRVGHEKALRLLGTNESRYPVPGPIVPNPLSTSAVATFLEHHPHWRLEETRLEGDPRFESDYKRQEIVRDFRFETFLQAIDFMRSAADAIDKFDHHPRWENVFKTVTVRFSTWDIGHRPSDRDVKCAEMLEKEYQRFLGKL